MKKLLRNTLISIIIAGATLLPLSCENFLFPEQNTTDTVSTIEDSSEVDTSVSLVESMVFVDLASLNNAEKNSMIIRLQQENSELKKDNEILVERITSTNEVLKEVTESFEVTTEELQNSNELLKEAEVNLEKSNEIINSKPTLGVSGKIGYANNSIAYGGELSYHITKSITIDGGAFFADGEVIPMIGISISF